VAKIGRNEPCWCGSGKKFKKCHLERQRQAALSPDERFRLYRKAHGARGCLHPDAGAACRGDIVNGHTLRRRADLDRIARDGHVYGVRPGIFRPPTEWRPELIGVRRASTFTGFCAEHDSRLFEPLERAPFEATPEQVTLLAYRTFCRELFVKQSALQFIPTMREGDRGAPPGFQRVAQAMLRAFEAATAATVRDLETHKRRLDEMLRRGDYSDTHCLAVFFEQTPEVLFTGGWFPDVAVTGEGLQNLADTSRTLDWMTLSLITTEKGGAAVFAWVAPSPASERFADSVARLTDDEMPHTVLRIAYHCENSFSAPGWWEGLAGGDRDAIVARYLDYADPTSPPRPDRFRDDGARLVNWRVENRRSF
jgi:hypothetical protein